MTAIKESDASPKGNKTVGKGLLTEKGAELLQKFSFNRNKSRFDFLALPHHQLDLEQGIISLNNVNGSLSTFPAAAKQLGIQLLLLRVDFKGGDCVMEKSELYF